MGHEANRSRNTFLLAIAFLLVFLFLIPLQARATKEEQPNSQPAAQSESFKVIRSDDSGVVFEISPPEFVRTPIETEQGTFDQIRIPGYDYTGVVGQPDLPQKGFLIALPPGAVPVLNLISAENQQLAGNDIAPTAENTLLNKDYDQFTSADYFPDFETTHPFDESVYNQDANYPAAPVSLGQETTLRHQRGVWVIVNPVQFNPVQKTLTVHDRLQIEVTFEFPDGRPAVETLAPDTGVFADVLQANFINYQQSLNWRLRETESSVMPETSPCMNPNAFRINVKQTGMYTVTYADLAAAQTGFPSSVPSSKIRMCYEDQEIRIRVNDGGDNNFNSGDSLIFYGESIKTQETETNVYWLTYSTSGVNGLRMTVESDSSGGTTPTYYIPSYHLETDTKYYSVIPMADLNDHWYWQEPIVAEPNNPNVDNKLDVTFPMSNKAGGTYTFIIRVELWGFALDEDHEFEVKLNGTSVGTGQFTGSGIDGAFYVYEGNAPSAALINGTNIVSIIAVDTDGDPNNTGQRFLVNWVEVEPRRQLVAQNNHLAFDVETPNSYTLSASNFTSNAMVEFFDVTDANNPTYQSRMATGGVVSFNRSIVSQAKYQMYATTAYLSPDAVIKDSIGSGYLATPSNTADYILITVPELNSALDPLRTRRTSQGLTVKTVFVQDIFDEFSYGRYATYAIHDFLEYAYNNWNGDLDYVLLGGDGSYDHRNVLGNNGNSNRVPVFLLSGADSILGEAASDNQYVVFSPTSDLAQFMLGRLPAQTTAEMSNMVSKILAYETAQDNPAWRGRHFFVVDNPYVPPTCDLDPAGDFFQTINNFIANHFPDNQILARLYYAPAACFPNSTYPVIEGYYATTLPDMQSRLIMQYNQGNQFIIYSGHGATQRWGHEDYFNISSVPYLNNGTRTPIMLPMTCLEGWYHFNGTTNGLSEAELKRVGGGAVASYAPTGFQVQTGHDYLLTGFYEAVYENDVQTLGEAVLQAKANLESGSPYYHDLHNTFMLLGDPGMRFNIPPVSQTFLPASLRQ